MAQYYQFNQLNLSINDTNNIEEDTDDDYNNENKLISYFEWMNTVETIVFNHTGLYLDDLPDETYRINFDDGMSCVDMAKIVIDPYNDMLNDLISDTVTRGLFQN